MFIYLIVMSFFVSLFVLRILCVCVWGRDGIVLMVAPASSGRLVTGHDNIYHSLTLGTIMVNPRGHSITVLILFQPMSHMF